MDNKRKSERIDASWECSIRMYLKTASAKHQVKLVNCSESGLCMDVTGHVEELGVLDRANLLFQAGDESCAFSATVKWVAPGNGQAGGDCAPVTRYGVKIDRGTESNPDLYRSYVQFLFLKKRFG
ncbi:MAG: PilZ domain-containing protein [Deltaproteobacteria bacterium]|nr:PilZ domain-containing protein [Deltaproteobacteria bacterium]